MRNIRWQKMALGAANGLLDGVTALLVLLADIGARLVNPPYETPLGAITALIGVPFFMVLANRERKGV